MLCHSAYEVEKANFTLRLTKKVIDNPNKRIAFSLFTFLTCITM